MKFNPEDGLDYGPHCRNCHKGSSACATCHNDNLASPKHYATTDQAAAADNYGWVDPADPGKGYSTYVTTQTSTGLVNIGSAIDGVWNVATPTFVDGFYKKSRTASWVSTWRSETGKVNPGQVMTSSGVGSPCNDDGFSWPHRTLGWKMLKDDLFGLNFDGTAAPLGSTRTFNSQTFAVHDIDSVCLDCHNPNVWNDGQMQTVAGHVDSTTTATDNKNDELLLRGLP